jgi:hypothetical protein
MVKGNFFDDTFEKLAELGNSTSKKTVKAVSQTFSPLKISEKLIALESNQSISNQEKINQPQSNNHTPLNFEKLNNSYAKQDARKQEELKNRLFQLIKQGDERILQENEERKKQEKIMEERKKEEEERRRRQLQQQANQQEIIPRGKIRRSIFLPKKVAQKQHTEIRPSIGKN